MAKIQTWTQAFASEELDKRLNRAISHRHQYEDDWKANEAAMYESERSNDAGVSPDDISGFDLIGDGGSMSEIKMNYAMKYVRFIHAQMSANPPSAIPKPTSQDYTDRRSAEVADNLIQHGIREHKASEHFDLTSLDAILYGVGWLRCWFNPHIGDIVETDTEEEEVTLEGDNEFKRLSPWDTYWDSGATNWEDVRYVFIEHKLPIEEAKFLWPQHAKDIEATKSPNKKGFFDHDSIESNEDTISVFEYVEKGLPWNGGVGRYVWMLKSGLLLTELSESPFPNAELPLRPLTDIDVPGQVIGRAVMSYLRRAQEVLTAIDGTMLDNIQAHGVIRMVLPDGAELQDDSITNNGWEVSKMSGGAGQGPHFMQPGQMMPDMHTFRAQLIQGMEEIAGINESMMGKQSREMSGFSMQTAINAGNMTRRRLFNKYTQLVKWAWSTYLGNVKEFWEDDRKILVTGEEEGLNVAYFSGADIQGGFDIQVDYGESFSLDPASRREEIMQLAPMLKEAGMSPQAILQKIKLNDIKGIYDLNSMAQRRQEEIFEEMIAKAEQGTAEYIEPRELEEHKGMLDAAYKYIMTRRFYQLSNDVKILIEKHIKAREAMAAPVAEPAGMPPAGGMPVAPPMPM